MSFKRFYETADQKTLIIMRGVSGTGKSTRAKQLAADGGTIFSTDDFFGQGEDYRRNFSHERLPEAHQWNQQRTEQAMTSGISPIVVDNTNINGYEAKAYVLLARKHGYEVRIEEPNSPHWDRVRDLHLQMQQLASELAGKNLHGTPPEAIARMISQYRPYSVEDAEASIAPWERPNSE